MREQLIQYVSLLFAGAPQSDDIRQEILQNTLDRYDDLIAQGKPPEAAYRLAISGIGDINEILGAEPAGGVSRAAATARERTAEDPSKEKEQKLVSAFATAFYILCPVPLFILQDEIGLSMMCLLIAAATALLIIRGKDKPGEDARREEQRSNPNRQLKRSISSLVWAVGVAAYFIVSFATHAWFITWVMFPLIASIQGLIAACMDLKEEN